MRPRFFIGVGAWLLGAVAATAGSLYAVDQLGQDLSMQQSKQVSVAMVNSDLALENSEHRMPLSGSSPSATPSAKPPVKPGKSRSPSPSPSSGPGRLLTSSDGTVVATCQNGLVYLVYASPYNGFEVDDIFRGPAAVARVVFRDSFGRGIEMDISCHSGQPQATMSPVRRDE